MKFIFYPVYDNLVLTVAEDEVRKRAGSSLIEILYKCQASSTGTVDDAQARLAVIGEALQGLESIHQSLISAGREDFGTHLPPEDARGDAKRRRVVYTLLDLVSIEGVYPCLSSGVGIPLEKRVISNLPAGVVARKVPELGSQRPRDEALLYRIMLSLSTILLDVPEKGIQPLLGGRILSDVISAAADLGFNSSQISSQEKFNAQNILERIIAR